MKLTVLLRHISLSVLLAFTTAYSSAQTSKIALIFIADTTIVHQHVGTTAFTNFTDTLHLDVAAKQHIGEQLKRYLSRSYEVNMVNLPDSVYSEKKGLYGGFGLSKEVKAWLTASKSQYDFAIFIDNMEIPSEINLLIPRKTSGLYTRGKTIGCYTTINFSAYRTSSLKLLEYYTLGGKLVTPLENFKLPEDKQTFTPDMLLILKDGLIKHLDSRVEFFLTKTFLVPQNKIDEIKASNP